MSDPTGTSTAVKRRSNNHTTATTLATALRGLADLLETLGDVEFAQTDLAVRLQVVQAPYSKATDAERARTVELFAGLVTDADDALDYAPTGDLYVLKTRYRQLDGLQFDAFGAMAYPGKPRHTLACDHLEQALIIAGEALGDHDYIYARRDIEQTIAAMRLERTNLHDSGECPGGAL